MVRVRSTEALDESAAAAAAAAVGAGGGSDAVRTDAAIAAANAAEQGEHASDNNKTEKTSSPPPTTAESSSELLDTSETRKAAAQDAADEKDVVDADLPLDAESDAPLNGGTTNDEDEFSLAGDDNDTPSSVTPAPSVDDTEPILTATPSPAPLPVDDGEPPVTTTPPVVVETTPTPTATLAVTAKPMLRTDAAVSNSATLHSRLNQGSPVLLLSFAVICCGFLLLWVRKRRAHDATGGSDKSAAAASSSKVQYSRIENKSESPFEDNDDADDSDDGRWDDWEGGDMGRLADEPHVTTTAYQSSLYANPNPFAAAAASPPMSLDVVAQSTPPLSLRSPFAVVPRLSAPLSADTYARDLLVPDVAVPLASSVYTGPGSNSSSDSYEVVTDDPALLHSSPFTSSKAAPPSTSSFADEADKQQDEADDLFSQFGMVPTFKKSAQPALPAFMQQQPPAPSKPSRSSHRPSAGVATAPVSAAAASALFAAEMEDLTAVAASDEWGEDDEWVQGI